MQIKSVTYAFAPHPEVCVHYDDHPCSSIERMLKDEMVNGRHQIAMLEAINVTVDQVESIETRWLDDICKVRSEMSLAKDEIPSPEKTEDMYQSLVLDYSPTEAVFLTMAAKYELCPAVLEAYGNEERKQLADIDAKLHSSPISYGIDRSIQNRDLLEAFLIKLEQLSHRGEYHLVRHKNILDRIPSVFDRYLSKTKQDNMQEPLSAIAVMGPFHFPLVFMHNNSLRDISARGIIDPSHKGFTLLRRSCRTGKDMLDKAEAYFDKSHLAISIGCDLSEKHLTFIVRGILYYTIYEEAQLEGGSTLNDRHLEALKKVDNLRYEDFEKIAEQYKGCESLEMILS